MGAAVDFAAGSDVFFFLSAPMSKEEKPNVRARARKRRVNFLLVEPLLHSDDLSCAV